MPADLPQTFERALAHIVKSRKSELVIKIFRWVAAVNRPLSLDELREAIAIKPCQDSLNSDQLINDISQVVSWCANLVIVDEEEHLVQFAHHSIKEYLLSDKISFEFLNFHLELSRIDRETGEFCVTYLSMKDFKTQLTKGSSVSATSWEPKSIAKASLAAGMSPTVLRSWAMLDKFLGRTRTKNVDILQQLHSVFINGPASSTQKLQARYSFLAYASEHWLSHTKNFTIGVSDLWRLWKNLVQDENTLAARPWTSNEWYSGHNNVKQYITSYSHCALLCLLRYSVPNSYLEDTQNTAFLLNAAERADDLVLNQLVDLQLQDQRPLSLLALDNAIRIAADSGRVRLIEALLSDPNFMKGVPLCEGMISASRKGDQTSISRLFCMLETDDNVSHSIKGEIIESAFKAAKWREVFLRLNDMRTNNMAYQTAFLQKATVTGDTDAVKRIVKDWPLDQLGLTALQIAVRHGHIEVVELLIAEHVDVNGRGILGSTALDIAAEMGRLEIVKLLIANKADINYSPPSPLTLTPLLAASKHGYIEIVQLLISKKANVNAWGSSDLQICTALGAAAEKGHKTVVQLLLANGANVNLPRKVEDHLIALQAAVRNGHTDIVRVLIAAKANVNAFTKYGMTALIAAAENGHTDIVRILIAAKANVNARTNDGMTALITAAENGHIEVVKILIAAEANLNAQFENDATPLGVAAKNGHIEIAELLIAAKADLNASIRGGTTALIAAAENGHIEIVRILIAAKVDVDASTCAMALNAAAANEHGEIVNLLMTGERWFTYQA